jgi:hypothetical protein
MRRISLSLVVAVALVLSLATVSQSGASGGLSPGQLNAHGWTCFNVPGLGVHCSAPGKPFPPTGPHAQLLYFFNTEDPSSRVPDFTGTESLVRNDHFHGQPCPTEPDGEYHLLGDLGSGAEYWGCHRH